MQFLVQRGYWDALCTVPWWLESGIAIGLINYNRASVGLSGGL